MTARDKTRPFTTKSDKAMRDEAKPDHAQELAAASERFARLLRTAPAETTKTRERDIRTRSSVVTSARSGRPRSSRSGIDTSANPSIRRPSISAAFGVTPGATSLG